MSFRRRPASGVRKPGKRDHAWLVELLKDAESVSRLTDFEEEFLSGFRDRVLQYGDKTFVSEKQLAILEKIEEKVHET